MHRRLAFALSTAAITVPFLAAAGARQESALTRVSWIAGCWEGTRGEERFDEQWMRPRGEAMFGMSRTVRGNQTVEFEFMDIRLLDGRLVFTARPSGQGEFSFTSIELTGSKVVFENTAHDFPQRIIYKRDVDGSLAARIEGAQGGQPRGIDFPMRRAKCGEDVGR